MFLTGQEEIEACERLISERGAALPPDPDRPALLVLPIYAALPPEQQLRVFAPAPPNTRKVWAGERRQPAVLLSAVPGVSCPERSLWTSPLPDLHFTSAAACQPPRYANLLCGCCTPLLLRADHPVHQHCRDIHHHLWSALRD